MQSDEAMSPSPRVAAKSSLGAWMFRQRSWLPVPFALVLVLVHRGELKSPGVFAAGCGLVLSGVALRFWAVRHIGTISRTRSLSRSGPLITSGPFGLTRNPLYVGNWFIWTGLAVASTLLWMVPVGWAVFALQYGAITRWEEQRLRDHFGPSYEAYARDVPRWIPDFPAAPRPSSAASGHSWQDVAFSERGTLIAAAAMALLLALKQFVW